VLRLLVILVKMAGCVMLSTVKKKLLVKNALKTIVKSFVNSLPHSLLFVTTAEN